jgi:hypothetical protein
MATTSVGCAYLRGSALPIFHFEILTVRQGMLFGFGIGINVTQAVFLGTPPPVGFGLTPFAISGSYGTPIVCYSPISCLLTGVSLQLTAEVFLHCFTNKTYVEPGSFRSYTADQNIPQVAVLIGELIGRYLNDWIMNFTIRRNKGVHEAETRLWCVTL